jgi:hypothetical protein
MLKEFGLMEYIKVENTEVSLEQASVLIKEMLRVLNIVS